MYYDSHPKARGIEIRFVEELDVASVSEAHAERADYLESICDGDSVSGYAQRVANWRGDRQTYRGAGPDSLVGILEDFCDATGERVDEILGNSANPRRLTQAGRRYELAHNAAGLLESIRLQSALDAELNEL